MPDILERILRIFKAVVTVPELIEETVAEVGGVTSSKDKLEATSSGAICLSKYKQSFLMKSTCYVMENLSECMI